MGGTFTWPKTDEEAITHLRERHGVWVKSLANWRELFGERERPKAVHVHDHKVCTVSKLGHGHVDYARFP